MKSKLLVTLMIGTLLAIGLGKYLIPTFGNYSDGERSGVLQKFSHKGNFSKTYEGEIALDGIASVPTNGNISSVFAFTVTDNTVAAKVKSLQGKKVKVHYIQVYHRNRFDGDTEYTVDLISEIK